jgi:uncharacterized protein YggE
MRLQGSFLFIALALFPAAAGAQTQLVTTPEPRLLSVTGEGISYGRPDLALITLGVVSEARTAGEALTANSQSMAGITNELKGHGIEARDLQTANFSVEPIHSQPPQTQQSAEPFRPEIVGYRVRNDLLLRIRDLTQVGAILDQVVTLGANSVSGPTFTVADPTPLEDQARQLAVRDALRKAGLYAGAASIQLGPIHRIEEGFIQPPQPLQGAMMRMEAADASVPIESGELEFRAQVSISWQIAD